MMRLSKNHSIRDRATKKVRGRTMRSGGSGYPKKSDHSFYPEALLLLSYAIRTKKQGEEFIRRLRSLQD